MTVSFKPQDRASICRLSVEPSNCSYGTLRSPRTYPVRRRYALKVWQRVYPVEKRKTLVPQGFRLDCRAGPQNRPSAKYAVFAPKTRVK